MQDALPDVNVWLAMAWRNHAFHKAAKKWFHGFEGVCCFCRVTQMGFLRLTTNRKILGGNVLTQAEAWLAYRRLLGDPHVVFREEPASVETEWQTLSSRADPASKRWTDDYLAAFASVAGLRLVTFDQGFSDYPGIASLILSPPSPS
jgi:toxin-antitoxin system PIN domain toxin